jgi:hypothetical protein
VKALTVQQPWAWAIVHGGKDVENRTQLWAHRGELAIHAGRRWSDRGARMVPSIIAAEQLVERYDLPVQARVGGVIIGLVDVVDVHHYAGSGPDRIDCCDSRWAEESYDEAGGKHRLDIVHLVLENPRPLLEPVPCRGALGLWTVPAGVDDQVYLQLEGVA